MNYVLDACALIAVLNKEEGKEAVKEILKRAADDEDTVVYINAVNLIEVYYGYIRELGKEKAAAILERIYAAPIKIIETISAPVYREASRLKAAYKMSLADAVGLATAINLKGFFVTSDGEFEEAGEREQAPLIWFCGKKQRGKN
jgi:predicted nucleic acid-binding protein